MEILGIIWVGIALLAFLVYILGSFVGIFIMKRKSLPTAFVFAFYVLALSVPAASGEPDPVRAIIALLILVTLGVVSALHILRRRDRLERFIAGAGLVLFLTTFPALMAEFSVR